MFQKAILVINFISYGFGTAWEMISDLITLHIRSRKHALLPPLDMNSDRPNIVIVGASFAGYHAARLIAGKLPPSSNHRVVVVEPHSHFHFTWVLPRFCVVDQEHKAFIPYGPYLSSAQAGRVQWIQDRVLEVDEKSIRLQGSGERIPYEFLVIATGSGATMGLPSRVGADQKEDGLECLRDMQKNIQDAHNLIVVGAGAAGFELATDAKHKYPEKHVTLVHSRDAVLNRFGPELRAAAAKSLKDLGVEVILGQRMESISIIDEQVALKSGRKLKCDFMVSFTPISTLRSMY
jgi:NADH dehydrogenase FAD-containing subunit